MTMYQQTLALLKATDEPVASLCRRANVGSRWLRRLIRGDYAEPGVNKIERLYRCLQDRSVDYSNPDQKAA